MHCLCFPGVRIIGHDTTAIYGENATFFCQLTETKDQLTRIIWKKKTQEDSAEKFFFSIRAGGKTEHLNGLGDRVQFIGNFAEKNGSIQLLRMRLLDEGMYTCIFNLISSGPFETNINATVFGMLPCSCNSYIDLCFDSQPMMELSLLKYFMLTTRLKRLSSYRNGLC